MDPGFSEWGGGRHGCGSGKGAIEPFAMCA